MLCEITHTLPVVSSLSLHVAARRCFSQRNHDRLRPQKEHAVMKVCEEDAPVIMTTGRQGCRLAAVAVIADACTGRSFTSAIAVMSALHVSM